MASTKLVVDVPEWTFPDAVAEGGQHRLQGVKRCEWAARVHLSKYIAAKEGEAEERLTFAQWGEIAGVSGDTFAVERAIGMLTLAHGFTDGSPDYEKAKALLRKSTKARERVLDAAKPKASVAAIANAAKTKGTRGGGRPVKDTRLVEMLNDILDKIGKADWSADPLTEARNAADMIRDALAKASVAEKQAA